MRVIASKSRARIWLWLDQRQARGAAATRASKSCTLTRKGEAVPGRADGRVGCVTDEGNDGSRRGGEDRGRARRCAGCQAGKAALTMEPEKPASREQGGDQTVGDHGTEAEAFEKTERGARGARRQRWVAALVLGLGGVGVGGGRVLGASSLKRRTTRSPRGAEIRNRQTRAVRRVREVGRAAHDSSSRWPSLRASLELPRWANLRPQGVARQAQTRGLGAGRAISPFDARARGCARFA